MTTGTQRGAVRSPSRRASHTVKRALDVVAAAAGLLLASPLLAVTAIAVRATMGSPVLFRQVRPGLHGRPFRIIKFRTMRAPRPGEVWHRTDAERVTRLGRLLRATSLDELPELWNVLRGEMSLVGPRPLLMEYLAEYTPEEWRRHDVLPGITGWAAVNGRCNLELRDRFKLDVWYVDHWSLWLDLRILARTAIQVVRRQDVFPERELKVLGLGDQDRDVEGTSWMKQKAPSGANTGERGT
ncbi:sugar transferase [Anaeromyxobacter paludicola]|uniref:Sugar transferase n=1 Tax=Anaeromyxobacter paludicola TaxID=2918171 RepID=A0ABM7X9L9_9BACT|nr:sugar transferase [Anaeromyxobacter paludicola]BDG08533.1 sugar transferase [Anaeromyxobacter paludicola]